VACKAWGEDWSGCTVRIACDNEPSVQVILTGRSTDTFMQACARELIYLQARYDFALSAYHIPGETNRLADALSRWHTSPSYQRQWQTATADELWNETLVRQEWFDFTHAW